MKRNILNLMFLSAVLCSCATQEKEDNTIDTTGYTSFHVRMESLDAGDTNHEEVWSEGTALGVFGSECGENEKYNLRKADHGRNEALFYGPLVVGQIMAYAPYEENVALKDGKLPLVLPQMQPYSTQSSLHEHFTSCCSKAFATPDESGILSFRWPAGMLGIIFDFSEPISVSSIELDSSKPVSGYFLVDEACRTYATESSLYSIGLELDENVLSEENGEKAIFLFVLPSGIYAAGELSLSVLSGTDHLHMKLPETEIFRAEYGNLPVTEVKVGISQLPGFEREEGFIE